MAHPNPSGDGASPSPSPSTSDVVPPDDDPTAVVLARGTWVRAPRQARSAATLRAIVDAADALIIEQGFDMVSVDDIVERAGRTVGSFYARFDDKLAVLRVLADRDWEVMVRLADQFWSVERWHDAPLDEVLATTAEVLVRRYRNVTPALRAAASYSLTDPTFRAQRRLAFSRVGERFGAVIEDHAAEVGHPDPARAAALAFTAMFAVLEFRRMFGDVAGGVLVDDDAHARARHEVAASILRPTEPSPAG